MRHPSRPEVRVLRILPATTKAGRKRGPPKGKRYPNTIMASVPFQSLPGSGRPNIAPEAAIDRFLDAIWMERGLSANTLAAYRADLTALDKWFEGRGTILPEATRADILEFIAWRVEMGARPRSTARQLSSFRRYYRFLVREG